MKSPYRNVEWFSVKFRVQGAEVGLAPIAASSGVMKSFTREVTSFADDEGDREVDEIAAE